jgi:cell division septation protein DedD
LINGQKNFAATALRAVLRVSVVCAISFPFAPSASAQMTPADSAARRTVFQRAQRLVNDGNGADGRALLDSLLNATAPRSAAEAEVLFQRATIAESWDLAQRDYLRVMLEHERSPRAAAAMLRLAQGELARGDRAAALRYLERLASEAPESPLRGEAGVWHGRLLIDRGARDQGCAVLRTTRARVDSTAIELVNQYDYLLRSCPAVVGDAATAPPAPTPAAPTPAPVRTPAPTTPATTAPVTAPAVTPTTTPAPAPATAPAPSTTTPAAPATTGPTDWSVQVAAWPTMEEAEKFAADIRGRGYEVRVDGTSAPFRVRFGRYPTREAATAAMNAYKQKERGNAFLVQVPRG